MDHQVFISHMAHVTYVEPVITPYVQPGTSAPAAPNRSTTNTQTYLATMHIS